MVDEFIYQYQEFCQYTSKTKDISPEEVSFLKSRRDVWNTVSVLKLLHRLVDKSHIKETLEREKKGLTADPHNLFASSQVYQFLGYWSIIGLCRVHVILGDYFLALKSLDPIEIHKKKAKYTQVTTAYISLYYYLGFSYLMLRRYHDSIKTFSHILLYISRVKQFQTRQYDQKKNDHMYALLAILVALCPKRIDEHINNILRQEHSDKVAAMQRDSEQLFSYACPKFVSPALPTFPENEISQHQTPLPLQRGGFMREINQQASLATILSYLKLYSSISLDKLVSLLEKKVDRETIRMQLFCLTHKTRQLQIKSGMKPTEGSWESSTHLEFWMEGDMIHIVDNTVTRKYGEVFLRNCNKLEEMIVDIEKQSS